MRLLADENFPKPIVEALRADGHDVLWARTDLAGTSDVALLDLAESEARIVLTLDKDFWQIAVQRRSPLEQSGVVLFRVHPATPERLAPLVHAFGAADTAWAGHISIITVDGIQMVAARRKYHAVVHRHLCLVAVGSAGDHHALALDIAAHADCPIAVGIACRRAGSALGRRARARPASS